MEIQKLNQYNNFKSHQITCAFAIRFVHTHTIWMWIFVVYKCICKQMHLECACINFTVVWIISLNLKSYCKNWEFCWPLNVEWLNQSSIPMIRHVLDIFHLKFKALGSLALGHWFRHAHTFISMKILMGTWRLTFWPMKIGKKNVSEFRKERKKEEEKTNLKLVL